MLYAVPAKVLGGPTLVRIEDAPYGENDHQTQDETIKDRRSAHSRH